VTPGDLEFVEYLAAGAIGLGGSAAVILIDRRRLTGEAFERSWPTSTLAAALWYLSPFCVIAHFGLTRSGKRASALKIALGWGIGLAWFFAILAAEMAAAALVEAAVDWLGV
jgi:hypothetical protein